MPQLNDPQPPSLAAAGRSAERLVLVRYGGEVTTKARYTRKHFVQRIASNLKDALASSGCEGKIQQSRDRMFVRVRGDGDLSALARVFGVQSLAEVEPREWREVADLVAAGRELFADRVVGKRFAVRVRRVGERRRIPLQRVDLERALGSELIGRSAGVDLEHPEVALRIEVAPGLAYFFSESVPGPGGLPLGVEGRAVALVSGGFDSIVAAWQLMKRGVALDLVFCNLGGRSHQLEAMRVLMDLADRWCYGTRPRLHAIDFDPVSREIQDQTETRYWQVVLKRSMLRAAEAVATQRGAVAIVTGDAVGQVSSQTLQNIAVISEATSLPILRPLIGFNKEEILDIARRIETYELSKLVGEYCALVPSKPATAATLPVIRTEEAKLDPALLEGVIAEREIFDLRQLDLASFESPELETDEISADATVLDLRSKAAYQGWHYPDALFLDFQSALRAYPQMNDATPYVLYCEFGLKSAHLAELMRARGLHASHFGGGLRALVAYAREKGLPVPE